LTRTMLLHYFTPWYYLYLIQLHVLFCHESWDSDSGENVYEDKSTSYVSWFYDAFLKELQDAWQMIKSVFMFFAIHYLYVHALSFIFFEKWNISENDEIRFYGVAPHWYFRPLMGILVISPTHYEGLMWMALFFILLSFLPVIYNLYNTHTKHVPTIPMQNSIFQSTTFSLFMLSLFCSASMLPCGRYYYDPEGGYVGNPWIKWCLQYIYLYMGWLLHHLDIIDHYMFQFIIAMRDKLKKVYGEIRELIISLGFIIERPSNFLRLVEIQNIKQSKQRLAWK